MKPELIRLGVKAVYSIIDFGNAEMNIQAENQLQMINEDFNSMETPLNSMLYLYIILTITEILISISGLAYSYDQAPNSLKAFASSLWLLPVFFGNVIVVILNHIQMFQRSVLNYFLFNVWLSIFLFFMYLYIVAKYETTQEYALRKSKEMKQLRKNEYELKDLI